MAEVKDTRRVDTSAEEQRQEDQRQENTRQDGRKAAGPTAGQQADNRQVVQGVQKMTPSEAFVETMVANGVTDMFGITIPPQAPLSG